MPKDFTAFPELLTGGEARQVAGVSTAIWMEMLELDRLPKPVRVGPRWKWRKADILKWVAELEPADIFA